jgi:hypothetical protein
VVSAKSITLQITKHLYGHMLTEYKQCLCTSTTSIKKMPPNDLNVVLCSFFIPLCVSSFITAVMSSHVSYGVIIAPRAALPSHTQSIYGFSVGIRWSEKLGIFRA